MKLCVPLPYETSERLTDYLCSENGQISLTIPDGVLPGFLIEAYNAAIAGRCHQAAAVLSPQNMYRLDQLLAARHPGALASLLTLALVMQRLERQAEALQLYEALMQIEPHPLLLNEQALLYRIRGHFSQALHCSRRAHEMAPDDSGTFAAYVHDLMQTGRLQDGLALIQSQVERGTVSAALHSQLLLYSHYLPNLDRDGLLQAHLRWAQMHAPVHLAGSGHTNSLDPDRRLRIGFLSATFCDHAAVYALEAFLDGLDRQAFAVVGYSTIQTADRVTERLAAKMTQFRTVHGMVDRAVAELIQQDQIDILVGVTGHTAGHRLGVLAYRPAPIQVDWGCINTTGMTQVDYRLTDRWFDPPGSDRGYVEALVRLPGGWSCFSPPRDASPVTSLPALGNGYLTFGSFNCHLKINSFVVGLWAKVMQAHPGSRLLLKNAAGSDPEIRQRFYQAFARHGVSADRIKMYCRVAPEAHWRLYNQMDVALDTYPFNGCITTLEALWMGVPVVSLCGEAWVSRMGLSLLATMGLEKFVAHSSEQYVAKTMALGANLSTLNRLRLTMRQRMLNSPLHDVKRFAGDIAQAFRLMWRHYCQKRSSTEIVYTAVPSKSKLEGVTP